MSSFQKLNLFVAFRLTGALINLVPLYKVIQFPLSLFINLCNAKGIAKLRVDNFSLQPTHVGFIYTPQTVVLLLSFSGGRKTQTEKER